MKKFKNKESNKTADELTFGNSRRERLIYRRNKRLVARYYYWSEIKRVRFDDVLELLQEEEFFIKERNIMNILNETNSYLDTLIKGKVTQKQLKKDYPAFNWSN